MPTKKSSTPPSLRFLNGIALSSIISMSCCFSVSANWRNTTCQLKNKINKSILNYILVDQWCANPDWFKAFWAGFRFRFVFKKKAVDSSPDLNLDSDLLGLWSQPKINALGFHYQLFIIRNGADLNPDSDLNQLDSDSGSRRWIQI